MHDRRTRTNLPSFLLKGNGRDCEPARQTPPVGGSAAASRLARLKEAAGVALAIAFLGLILGGIVAAICSVVYVAGRPQGGETIASGAVLFGTTVLSILFSVVRRAAWKAEG